MSGQAQTVTETTAQPAVDMEEIVAAIKEHIGKELTSWKGLVTSPLSVVFDAARDEDYRGMDDYLVFSKLTTNLGNGFDIETGKFTAPVSGLYFFALNVYGQPRDAVIMSIRSGLTQIKCPVVRT